MFLSSPFMVRVAFFYYIVFLREPIKKKGKRVTLRNLVEILNPYRSLIEPSPDSLWNPLRIPYRTL